VTAETINQAAEYLEHAERSPIGPHRFASTIAIAIITLLTAFTALLAANANWNTAVAQRHRALHAEQAATTLAQVQKQASDVEDEGLLVTEAYARLVAQAGPETGLSDIYRKLRAEALRQDQLPSQVYPAIVEQEQSTRDARVADRWLGREESDVGLAGFFAVDLFLIGVAVTMRRHRNRWILLWTACALALIGVVRLAVVNTGDLHAVSQSAIADYARGEAVGGAGDNAQAMQWFLRAVRANPSYAAAWVGLAESASAPETANKYLPVALSAYTNATRLGDDSETTLNNLAYVELVSGRLASARKDIAAAMTASQRGGGLDVYTRATQSEVALASGDGAAADSDRRLIIASLARDDSFLRDDVFSSLRADEAQMLAVHVLTYPQAEAFFAPLRVAEASLDAFQQPTPKTLPSADLSKVNTSLKLDRRTDQLIVHIDAPGVTSHDVVSVRLYDAGTDQFVRTASDLATSGAPQVAVRVPIYPDVDYVVETYVDAQRVGVTQWPSG